MEEVTIGKKALLDLVRLTGELNARVESLELASNKGFMESYRKAKTQIKKRDFADWNEL